MLLLGGPVLFSSVPGNCVCLLSKKRMSCVLSKNFYKNEVFRLLFHNVTSLIVKLRYLNDWFS